MHNQDIRSLFASCSSNAARRDALEGIVSQLTNHEWRYLRDRLATRPFQFDIVASLPVELAVLVFSHMELSALYRTRRVRFHGPQRPQHAFISSCRLLISRC